MPLSLPVSAVPRRTVAVLVSIAAGLLLGVAIRLNATLGEYVGVLESSFIVHLTGTAFALLLVGARLNRSVWKMLRRTPRHELTGGIIGVLMVLLANVTVPQLGVALAVSLFVAADLFFSSVSDHFGWLGLPQIRVSPQRVVGLLLVLAGVLLVRFG
jgi:transporter family-2 protein